MPASAERAHVLHSAFNREKRCTSCLGWFLATNVYFHRHNGSLASQCKQCKNISARKARERRDAEDRELAAQSRAATERRLREIVHDGCAHMEGIGYATH